MGAPNAFVCNPHTSQKSKEVREFCGKVSSTLRVLEEHTQHANRAELYIGLLKESIRKDLRESDAPLRLWCFCAERRADIFTLTAKNLFQLQGQNPYLATLGKMGDISNLCSFAWYEWVYFRQGKSPFPLMKEELGRCLGPTKNEGNEMAQWVLQQNGKIVPRRTLRRLTADELAPGNETEAEKRRAFNQAIKEKLGDSITLGPYKKHDLVEEEEVDEEDPTIMDWDPETYTPYEEVGQPPTLPLEADLVDAAGKRINQQSANDLLINAEVLLPTGEHQHMAKVLRRSVDEEGNLVGTFSDTSDLNTLLYDVEFPDGAVKQYAANIIAQNILY